MNTLKKSSNLMRAWWATLRTSPVGMLVDRYSELFLGICLFFCLLIITATTEYRQTVQLYDDAHLVVHAHEFVEALDDLLLTVREAETDHTYYLMTGEDKYLKTYAAAIASTKVKIGQIKQLAESSLEERRKFPRLLTLLDGELTQLETDVNVRKQMELDAAQLATLASQETRAMDALETEVEQMERFEHDRLAVEEEATTTDIRSATTTILVATPLVLASFGAFVWLLFRHHKVDRRGKDDSRPPGDL
jgi:CHASE3 domain sensor protein